MNRIVQIDPSEHRAVYELLPWYVSNALADDEIARVKAHLPNCPQCQTELDWQRTLHASQQAPLSYRSVERDFAALLARIEHPQTQPRASVWSQLVDRWHRMRGPGFTWATPIAAAVMLAALMSAPSTLAPVYHGLGASAPSGANLVIRFRPETSEQELRRLLRAHAAHLVGGPTLSDAYLVQVPPTNVKAALRGFRTESAVLWAESLTDGSEP